jgi:hypothetical protein
MMILAGLLAGTEQKAAHPPIVHNEGQGKRFAAPNTAPANKVCVHKQLQRLPLPAALNQYNDASIATLLLAMLTTPPAARASDPVPHAPLTQQTHKAG